MRPDLEYRPDLVSLEYYKTTQLWFVILYVNEVQSITEFNNILVPEIKVPMYEVVVPLIQRLKRSEVNEK